MDCSRPGFPVLHCLLKFEQTHVHWVGDAIQPSHPLPPPSPPDSIIVETNWTVSILCFNHPETIPTPIRGKKCLPWKRCLVPKKVADLWLGGWEASVLRDTGWKYSHQLCSSLLQTRDKPKWHEQLAGELNVVFFHWEKIKLTVWNKRRKMMQWTAARHQKFYLCKYKNACNIVSEVSWSDFTPHPLPTAHW